MPPPTNGDDSQLPSTSGQPTVASRSGLVPTNTVQLKDGTKVRARIEATLAVEDVIRQLLINLKIKDQPSRYALRDENDELVTNENLRKKIKGKVNLKLVNSPALEAEEILLKIQARDSRLGMALTSLRKLIREDEFAREFFDRDGLNELIAIINSTHGNTLAYALTAMQNLMELDHGWATLSPQFILRVVQIIASESSLINVCRPATAILKKLVEADPLSAPGSHLASSSSSRYPPTIAPDSVYRYGFEVVWEQMVKEQRLLEIVVNRLGSQDTTMALYSMMLINSLMAHASDVQWEEFIGEIERLNVPKAVIRLMASQTIEDLTSGILDFQANMVRVTYRKKTTIVEPEIEPTHTTSLVYIWQHSRQREEPDGEGGTLKWRKLGFESEDLMQEFEEVGVLGLDCLKNFIAQDPDYFAKIVQEQLSRPLERRCPIAKASNEVVDLLSEHWAIFGPGYSTSTTFQPFFLNFYNVHALATHFFLRMWNESGATKGDFSRVAALVRSQVKAALKRENVRAWHEVEEEFNDVEYRKVRDRQMRELEMEDDVMGKLPVRNFRAKLYKESYEFVRQQRVYCLMQGAWFMNGLPTPSNTSRDTIRRPRHQWRFLRLVRVPNVATVIARADPSTLAQDNSLKYLYYLDSAEKFDIRHGLEDLPERIDVTLISEVATGTCAPYPATVIRNATIDQTDALTYGPSSPSAASPLSFSLLTASGASIADQIAPDQARWADWVDGLNMLRRDGGHVASTETEKYVNALTEIGLKIRLLNLSGDMVDIPSGINAGHPPGNSDFFFSDLIYEAQA
ncbi:hypothetical protein EIP86_004608 [Pleurotus ostreatoroseus]|nr:hypothetical protein EIP86_004608 [Pleurotus ostreatoroseus]